MKILTSRSIAKRFGKIIEDLGYEVETYDRKNLNAKEDYGEDIIIASTSMKGMDITKHKNLKYIFTITVGIDYLDLDYLKNNNIILTNNNGIYADPIAEWIVYGLLQIEKSDRVNIKNQENKVWAPRLHSYNLYGKKILFLGTGSIARAAANRLIGFEMELNGFNTDGRKVEPFTNVYSIDEIDEVLKDMDYVVMCLPDTDETHHFLNRDRFNKMKDKAVIVNISRGATIDEDAMTYALQSGKLKGASLDVFEKEPLSEDSPLWEMENVYIYPHISFSSEDNEEREFKSALNNLKALKGDGDFVNIIDFDKGYWSKLNFDIGNFLINFAVSAIFIVAIIFFIYRKNPKYRKSLIDDCKGKVLGEIIDYRDPKIGTETITVKYNVDGKEYNLKSEVNRVKTDVKRVGRVPVSFTETARIKLKVGEKVNIFYNEKNPNIAYIEGNLGE